MHTDKLKATQKPAVIKVLLLIFFILILQIANAFVNLHSMAMKHGGAWTLSEGDWYYRSDPELKNSWLDNNYFIDEFGRMVSGEWVYNYEATIRHSKVISYKDMTHIDMNNLFYVGDDGLKVRNKKIYYTPISFDSEGRCSIDMNDFNFIDGTDSGLEGLRRYVAFNDGCKEYYY